MEELTNCAVIIVTSNWCALEGLLLKFRMDRMHGGCLEDALGSIAFIVLSRIEEKCWTDQNSLMPIHKHVHTYLPTKISVCGNFGFPRDDKRQR